MSTTSFVGRRVGTPVVPVRRKPLRLPLPLLILWWLIRLAVKVILIIARSPELLVIATIVVLDIVVIQRSGSVGVGIALDIWLIVVVIGLTLAFPALRRVLWSRWRWLSIYRFKWPATMDLAELNRRRSNGTQYEPVLLSVKSTPDVDRVRARMLASQTVDDWAKVSDRLLQTFGADDVRVRSVPGRPHEVECWFLVNDPLIQVVSPVQEVPVRLDALPVGLREDGEIYRLPLLGNHILIDGRTGAGKSGGEWAIVHALAPRIADGTVRLLGVDPKRDELSFGEPLFERLAYARPADFAEVLEAAVGIMQDRQDRMHGVSRLHKPTRDEPLYVVLVDELAAFTYLTDRDVKRRIEAAMGLLLSQGRAVGVSVVGCLQDARKETVPARGLYTVRVLLAVNEADEVGLVFSPGARDRGAKADKISPALQGVAFVEVDGEPEPVRIRFAHITDEHIETLAAGWRPPLQLVLDVEDDAA